MSSYQQQSHSSSTSFSIKRHLEVANLSIVEADRQEGTIQKITNLPNKQGLWIDVVQGLQAVSAKGKDLNQIVTVLTDKMGAVVIRIFLDKGELET